MNDIKYEGTVVDWDDELDEAERPRATLKLRTTSSAWWIYADGYDGFGNGPMVEIEMDHGVLLVRLWADRHEEEATHIISVEGMRRDCPAILRPHVYGSHTHWYPEEDAVRHARGMWPYAERWRSADDDFDEDELDDDDLDEEESEVCQ